MQRKQELVFAPLGGVGEIGMNLSVYGLGPEGNRKWLAVDLGVSFAQEEHLPGIDLIFPDIKYLIAERKNIAGMVITHAHEDHYGAILDLWPKLKIPLYATPFTAAMIAAKRAGEPGAPEIPVNIVAARQPLSGRRFRRRTLHHGAFDSGIECAHHPHALGRGAAYRRLEDRPHADPRHRHRRSQTARARRCGLSRHCRRFQPMPCATASRRRKAKSPATFRR